LGNKIELLIVFTHGGQLRDFFVPAEDLADVLFWSQCGEKRNES